MRKKSDIILFLAPIILDAISIFIAFILAYLIRFYSRLIPITKGIPAIGPYLSMAVFAMVVWIAILYLSKVYDTKKVRSVVDETYEVIKGIIIGTVIVLAPIFFYREFLFSRVTILLACIISGVLIMSGKGIIRVVKMALYRKGIAVHNACIVGGGNRAKEVIERFKKNPITGYRLVGKITEREDGNDLPILGNLFQIREIIEKNKIDTLILTFPLSEHKKAAKILLRCNGLPVDLKFVPDPYELLTSKIEYYDLDGFTMLGIKEFALTYWNALTKRIFDVVVTSILLIILAPLTLVISIIIKLSSKGPLFYRQKRIGKDEKVFEILKFRSMEMNAEETTGPVFATANDARTTNIGRVIRRWGIDEIPQLINVIKGQMSLVGPRPERPEFVEKFSEEISRYLERHRVRPGITGWAQVNGLRGNSSIKERVEYDLYYIENWSLGFDIKILLTTLSAIIRGENAY
ncbi:MAG: undecaprenyl-phosphate glucose phosphotransferase [bacterium]|nr:undecaprenyl-phosphate glucose phosphotransferase [bacterium]